MIDTRLTHARIFTVDSSGAATVELDLAETLDALTHESLLSFPRIRPHQEHAWYAFLVQLAAAVAGRSGPEGVLPPDPDAWRIGLIDLAGDSGDQAWKLWDKDPSHVAFLQPALPGVQDLRRWGNVVPTPDGLDVVSTTRNHEIKLGTVRQPRLEHWVYALVALQTLEGYSGRANYGIARMNGGYGSRPLVGAAPSLSLALRFRRDVGLLLERRPDLIRKYGYSPDGPVLLWTLAWNGKSSRPLQGLDPFFVEVCRHVRLIETDGHLLARVAGTDASLLEAKELKGDTGDSWTPMELRSEGRVALSAGARGFDYKKLVEILLGADWETPARELRPEDGATPVLIARVLARGQGATSGFHERTLPLTSRTRRLFSTPTGRERLAARARHRIEVVDQVKKKVLSPCLCSLLQGGKDQLDLADERRLPFLDHFEKRIDDIFFDALFADVDLATDDEADRAWRAILQQVVAATVRSAERTVPIPAATRERAIARADLILSGARKKIFGLESAPTSQQEST